MTAANDNFSTPNRVRNALRDDAVRAARWFSELPTESKTAEAHADALEQAQPYIDYLFVMEQIRPADVVFEEVSLSTEGRNTGYAIEHRHDTRPSVEATLTAYSDGLRCFVRRSPKGEIERFEGGTHRYPEDDAVVIGGRSSTGRFYGLRFHRGVLVHYGQNGRCETATDEQSDPRGPDADNDNVARLTTATPGAPVAIEEMRRRTQAERALSAWDVQSARLLDKILEADTFAEVAEAAGMRPTSHNGRRVTIKILAEAKNLLAA